MPAGADEAVQFAISAGVLDPDGSPITLACSRISSSVSDTDANTVDHTELTAIAVDHLALRTSS